MNALETLTEAKLSGFRGAEGRATAIPADTDNSMLLLLWFLVLMGMLGAILWRIRPALPPTALYKSSIELTVQPVAAVRSGVETYGGG